MKNNIEDQAIKIMKKHFDINKKWIEHSLKVLNYADSLLKKEGIKYPFIKDVVLLSAIFHDIGIPISEEKYGNRDHKNQEIEGGKLVKQYLKELEIREDIRERVVYIVSHHHTPSAIDGPDFEILWDADLLTNIEEGRIQIETYPEELGFKTKSGSNIYKEKEGR